MRGTHFFAGVIGTLRCEVEPNPRRDLFMLVLNSADAHIRGGPAAKLRDTLPHWSHRQFAAHSLTELDEGRTTAGGSKHLPILTRRLSSAEFALCLEGNEYLRGLIILA